jgi:hypothetical protein
MTKGYKVAGPFPVLGHQPGEVFEHDFDPAIEALHLEGGTLELDDGSSAPAEKVPCPRCVEEGSKRPPKFDDVAALQKHYADKHPALVAPDSLEGGK